MCYYCNTKICWSYDNTAGLCNDNRMKRNFRKKSKWKIIIKNMKWGVVFYPPLGIFMSMSSVVIQALPCFRAFLLLYKNIIRYRASMVNSAGWKSRVALPPTDRRHVKRRLAEPFGYSVTCALIGPWFLSVIFFYRPLIMQHGRKY